MGKPYPARRVPFTAADELRWRANGYQQTYYRLRAKGDYDGAAEAIRERDEYRRRACQVEAGIPL